MYHYLVPLFINFWQIRKRPFPCTELHFHEVENHHVEKANKYWHAPGNPFSSCDSSFSSLYGEKTSKPDVSLLGRVSSYADYLLVPDDLNRSNYPPRTYQTFHTISRNSQKNKYTLYQKNNRISVSLNVVSSSIFS